MKHFSGFLAALLVLLAFTVGSTSLHPKVTVGEEVLESYRTSHPYDGGKGLVLEQMYHWPGAGYIAVHFTGFDLAPNDYVEISSPDGKFSYEYRGKGKWINDKEDKNARQISEFWATHIPGDTAVVKLVSQNQNGGWGFEVDKWVHGYEPGYIEALLRDLEDEQFVGSEETGVGDKISQRSQAISRLLINGTSACTGWLLGSEGHVITTNQCIGTQDEANNTDYEFMSGTVAADSGTLIKTSTDLDYTLILLPENVTETYGYLQFRDSLPEIGERVYIPHSADAPANQTTVKEKGKAGGDIAKTASVNDIPGAEGHEYIGYYAHTAAGSLGSPVLDFKDHLVVALHHRNGVPAQGVPAPRIISDLGSQLPRDAVAYWCPSIDIIYPKTGSVAYQYGCLIVKWRTFCMAYQDVVIYLTRPGITLKRWETETGPDYPHKNVRKYCIPGDIAPGKDYRVKIKQKGSGTIYSTGFFEIKPAYIDVKCPPEPIYWIGDTLPIDWTTSLRCCKSTVRIYLTKEGYFEPVGNFASDYTYKNGPVNYKIPPDLPTGKYRIKIRMLGASVYDYSCWFWIID